MNSLDGVKTIFRWSKQTKERQSSHVVQMIDQGFTTDTVFGNSPLLLDRYFLFIPALERLNVWNR